MDNKKIIILSSITIAVISIFICYIYNKKELPPKSANNDIEKIDWSKYQTKEIALTESIEITEEGIYKLTGNIADGYLHINSDGNIKLILNNVKITNSSGPAIYIERANIIEINTKKGTNNTLTDGSSYKEFNDEIDACIFSTEDIIFSGNGTLKVIANYNDGIVSNDDIEINDGKYIINAKNDGIKGTNSIEINNGDFTIHALGDGLVATNSDEKGYIIINGGSFNIKTTNNEKDKSSKSIKATNSIEINDGNFILDNPDDSIHTDGNMIINGGTFKIKSSDDAIHADIMIEINDGKYDIKAAEGIEATYIKINDGNINIEASDDGINAGKKSDKYKPTIEINGGKIVIKVGKGDTDGIDSNGNLYINGGTINITADSPFDYDDEAKYNGGTIIVNGKKVNKITNQKNGAIPPNQKRP